MAFEFPSDDNEILAAIEKVEAAANGQVVSQPATNLLQNIVKWKQGVDANDAAILDATRQQMRDEGAL